MNKDLKNQERLRIALKNGTSFLAVAAIAALAVGPVYAQSTATSAKSDGAAEDASGKEVVVIGVRRSLKSAQQIKRDADTIVDSITATDIGAFPDKSVAEALQRVAGITVSRFAGTADTGHFSAEPSGVLVRGLPQVRSEFNGRDTFSANSSRGLSWGDVSPELMAGVDTYKNQTADLIEGGISGSINLRTRVPFDSKGQLIAISADAAYNDLSKQTTPDISGIYSNRYDTSIGEFGVMVNYAYSLVKTDTQGDQLSRIKIFDHSVFNNPITPENPMGRAYIPSGVTFRDTLYMRTRKGIAVAGQWQNHDHTMLATLQYNDSFYNNAWQEHNVSANAFGVWQLPASNVSSDKTVVEPAAGTGAFTFNSAGLFQTGVQTQKLLDNSDAGPYGRNDQGQAFFVGCYDWAGKTDAQCRQAANLGTASRYAFTKEKTKDTSFNFKWDPTDKIKLNFDLQYVDAVVENHDMTVDTATYANVLFDYSGKYPKVTIATPTDADHFAASAGGVTNPQNYHYNDLMDHSENSDGHELATKLDAQYNFESGGWLDSLKVGVRYADREQHIRWSAYNWASITQPWNGAPSSTTCYSVNSPCYPKQYEAVPFSPDLLGGGLINGSNNNVFVFTSIAAVKDTAGFAAAMNEVALGKAYNGSATSFPGWTPLCNRNASDPHWMANNNNQGTVDGCYLQKELTTVSEKTQAVYAELKFGGPDKRLFDGPTVSGNVGLRWVQTEDASDGYLSFPGSNFYLGAGPVVPGNGTKNCPLPIPGTVGNQSINCIPLAGAPNLQQAITFSNGASMPLTSTSTHINFLPSFNVKLGLTDQWILRFAASRAMSRPDMGYFKNYISVGAPSFDEKCQTATSCTRNSAGLVTDFTPIFTASSGNPSIKSTTADQFDISLEDYFNSVGSFTFDLFYKKFYNYIQFGAYQRTFTNNGITESVRVSGPINGDGASIRGFEVAYQRFFDFLPSPWNGLGVQANYTHLSNTGITNTHISSTSSDGNLNTGGSGINNAVEAIDPHTLEGLSDNSYNIVGMYEKGHWAARLAYNWRSNYLVSASDCCVGLPVWQRAAGYLDGSLRYRVSDNLELSVSGSNLTDTSTVILQQIEGDIPGKTPNAKPVLMPSAWWKNDRRLQVGIRLKY